MCVCVCVCACVCVCVNEQYWVHYKLFAITYLVGFNLPESIMEHWSIILAELQCKWFCE